MHKDTSVPTTSNSRIKKRKKNGPSDKLSFVPARYAYNILRCSRHFYLVRSWALNTFTIIMDVELCIQICLICAHVCNQILCFGFNNFHHLTALSLYAICVHKTLVVWPLNVAPNAKRKNKQKAKLLMVIMFSSNEQELNINKSTLSSRFFFAIHVCNWKIHN